MKRLAAAVVALVVLLLVPAAFAQEGGEAAPAPAAAATAAPAEPAAAEAPKAEEPKAEEPKAEPAVVPAAATEAGATVPATAKRKKKVASDAAPDAGSTASATAAPERPKPPELKDLMPPGTDMMKVQEMMKEQPTGAADDMKPPRPQDTVEAVARTFFLNLSSGDARSMTDDCGLPFVLEDRRFTGDEELFREWLKRVRSKRVDLLVLYGIEVLTPQEMEKKYGAPPPRLAQLPWKGAKTYVAIANLSGHAAVAVVREVAADQFRVVAYTD